MMHSAPIDSSSDAASRFKGGIVADLARHAELRYERVPSHAGLGVYEFAGAAAKHSGDTLREIITELLLEKSKRHRIDRDSLTQFSSYADLEVRGRAATSSLAALPMWVQHVNSNAKRSVGHVARTINLALRALDQEGADAINQELLKVNFEGADHYHFIALLRALADSRQSMANWTEAVRRARARLARDELDEDRLMQGLDG